MIHTGHACRVLRDEVLRDEVLRDEVLRDEVLREVVNRSCRQLAVEKRCREELPREESCREELSRGVALLITARRVCGGMRAKSCGDDMDVPLRGCAECAACGGMHAAPSWICRCAECARVSECECECKCMHRRRSSRPCACACIETGAEADLSRLYRAHLPLICPSICHI